MTPRPKLKADAYAVIQGIKDVRAEFLASPSTPHESLIPWLFERQRRIAQTKELYAAIAEVLVARDLMAREEADSIIATSKRIEPTWDGWLTAVELIVGTGEGKETEAAVLEGWARRIRQADERFAALLIAGTPLPSPRPRR